MASCQRRTNAAEGAVALLLAFMSLLVACGSGTRDNLATSRRIPVKVAFYIDVVWMRDGSLLVTLDPETSPAFTTETRKLNVDGSMSQPIPLPDDPAGTACFRTLYIGATLLPDGRVGMERKCFLAVGPTPTAPDPSHLVAYDPISGAVTTLVRNPFYTGVAHLAVTWNPRLTEGLASLTNGLEAGMTWFDAGGIESRPIVVRAGTERFSLPNLDVTRFGSGVQARGESPSWSPDGRQIAFFASPRSVGVDGFARLDEPWNLYLVDSSGGHARAVVRNISDPSGASWSPNGRAVVFGGTLSGVTGTWLLSVGSDDYRRISTMQLGSMSWSPDGSEVVGIHSVSSDAEKFDRLDLRILDVRPILPSGSS
jgi:hypothetical protein